jgi:hypothetical protein
VVSRQASGTGEGGGDGGDGADVVRVRWCRVAEPERACKSNGADCACGRLVFGVSMLAGLGDGRGWLC